MKGRLSGGVWLAALFSLSVASTVSAAEPTAARGDIQSLVTNFQKAIVARDGDALKTMFLPSGSNWWSAFDDGTLATVKKRKPDASREHAGDMVKFADFIKTTTHSPEEVFSNVQIQTDGIIGTVYFDYVFLLDGKPTNHGVETWQVIRTDAGWKISAMLYSEIDEVGAGVASSKKQACGSATLSPAEVVSIQAAAYNARDLDGFAACYADDVVMTDLSGKNPVISGQAALRKTFAYLGKPKAGAGVTIVERIVNGPVVIDKERPEGKTAAGEPLPDLVATYEVRAGKIVHAWFPPSR